MIVTNNYYFYSIHVLGFPEVSFHQDAKDLEHTVLYDAGVLGGRCS